MSAHPKVFKGGYSRRRRGFQLLEVIIATLLLSMAGTIFIALYPTATRSSRLVTSYSQAVSMVQHKADQLRAVGYGSLDYTNLHNSGLIDDSAKTSPFRFEVVDKIGDQLSNPVGEISVSDVATNLREVTVRLSWSDGPGAPRRRSHEVSLLIARAQ
jgi:type II secretory pathway pseudopilin PulG